MKLFLFLISALLFTVHAQARPSKFLVHKETSEAFTDIPVIQYTYDQKLDHFDSSDKRNFTQNYWVSPAYAESEDSPVLFYICGETACSSKDVMFMMPWAQTIKASIVVIEHRYYGASQPFPENTTENLAWMNMPQALADFAEIVTYLKEYGRMKGPWVVAGGSYSGMLSASFRLTYPDLVVGAWGSSAPLHTVLDDQSYDLQMATDMGPQCAASMRQVIAFAEHAVQDEASFAALRDKFNANILTDPDDFLFSIADVAAAAVQYRRTSILCDSFKTNDVIEDYAVFLKAMETALGYLPTSYSFATATDTTAGGPQSDNRTFFYQQCNEYGLFQTAYQDASLSVRSQRSNMEYMKKGCERLFGKVFEDGTIALNERYYQPFLSRGPGSSKIYFTNGSLDPWAPLGIAAENGNLTNPDIFAFMIPGSSHTDDLSFARKDNSPALEKSAENLVGFLTEWTARQ